MYGYSPGLAESLCEVRRQVTLVVQRLDLDARVGEVPRVVGADDRRDRAVLVGGRHRRPELTGGPVLPTDRRRVKLTIEHNWGPGMSRRLLGGGWTPS